MKNKVQYNPEIFEKKDLDEAKKIILTNEYMYFIKTKLVPQIKVTNSARNWCFTDIRPFLLKKQ